MGGGGAMRAAAKVAGIGVANCGLRGVMSEQPITSAARKAAKRPVSAISVSAADDVEAAAKLHVVSSPTRREWSEIDDWEFAGSEDDALFDSGREQMPRLVFGGAPSLTEAQEATSDLKGALEKVYLSSPKSTGYGGSDQDRGYSEMLQTKSCLTSEKTLAPAPPKHAIQAFRFLSESPAAQNVVASIACDPNVWNAVLQNPALQDYLKSQNSSASFSCGDSNAEESFANPDSLYQHSPKGSDVSSDSGESGFAGFENFLQDIKLTVVDMWTSLSDYFQNLFGSFGGPATYKLFADADGSARVGFTDRALNASFLGLAVMAIVVVVLKRGQSC